MQIDFHHAVTYVVARLAGFPHMKANIIGTKEITDDPGEVFKYTQTFPKSNWKMFHDALQAHRFAVLHDILPRYGIIAA